MQMELVHCGKCYFYYWSYVGACPHCTAGTLVQLNPLAKPEKPADKRDVDFVIFDALRKLHEEPTCK